MEAKYQGAFHEAVVLDVEDDPRMYHVHYKGWNSRYDQWLPAGRVRFASGKSGKPATKRSKKLEANGSGPRAAAVKTEAPEATGVTEESTTPVKVSYEQLRLENIRRNQAMLKALNVPLYTASLQKKKKKVFRRAKKSPEEMKAKRVPTRRSLRVQGLSSTGEKLPDNFKALPKNAYSTVPTSKYEDATMEVSESNRDFLKQLLSSESSDGAGGDAKADVDASIIDYAKRLAELSIDDDDFTKATPERIYSLEIHSGTDRILTASGDKYGHIGLAQAGTKDPIRLHPHNTVVAGLLFDKDNQNRLYSASYDSRVLALDMEQQEFVEVCDCEGDALYGLDSIQGDRIVYVSSESGFVRRLDPRSKSIVDEWECHDNKIYTVSINPSDPRYFCTSCLDRTMCIFDSRKFKKLKPLHRMTHGLCVTAASFSPDGKYLVSCCNDNLLRTWVVADLKKGSGGEDGPQPNATVKHWNQTGRWLSKFQCRWDPKQSGAFVVGSMDKPRCVEVFCTGPRKKKIQRVMRLRDDWIGSVQSLNVFHPTLDVIASANSSGRVHVWKRT